MKYRSAFKTLILCQLPDNHSFQGYSQLTFPSLVGQSHSELQYSPSHVGPPHCEECGPSQLGFPFPMGPPPFYHSFQGYSQLTFLSLVGHSHSELQYSPSRVGPPLCEKCVSATFRIFLSGGSATFLPQLSGLFLAYIFLTCGSATQ